METVRHYVGQEDRWSCGIATLAMVTGQSFQKVKDDLRWEPGGVGVNPTVMLNYLNRLGFHANEADLAPSCARPVSGDRMAIVIHRSRMQHDGFHAVVLFGDGVVFDPMTRTPRVWAEVRDEAILVLRVCR